MLRYFWGRLFKKIHGVSIRDSSVHRTARIHAGSQVIDSTIGKHSYCGYDCAIFNAKIGNFCAISSNVVIGGANHPVGWASVSPVFYRGRNGMTRKLTDHEFDFVPPETVIGSDVWIGHGALIKGGLNIGNGAVVGMGSVVTKDVPDYAVVAGNPAEFIRMRFDEETVRELLRMRWWEETDGEIKKRAVSIPDVQEFIGRR